MKEMHTDSRQITIYYNPGNTTHEKTVAHAKGTDKEILATPFDQAPTAHNIWTKIYEGLGPGGRDIFDPNDEKYDALIAGREFTYDDWHNIVVHNTDMIRNPIAISGDKVISVERPTEIYRLQELGPDQAAPVDVPPGSQAESDVDALGMMLDR